VTVKSGIEPSVFGGSEAVCSCEVLMVAIVAEKVAEVGVVDAGRQGEAEGPHRVSRVEP
jgi:hypothetical protein